MTVTFMQGNGKEKTFTHVIVINEHPSGLIEFKFADGHPYPAPQVYIGLDKSTKMEIQIAVSDEK